MSEEVAKPTLELTNGLMIAYGAIWTMAIIPIYIGSKLSLKSTNKNESMSKSDAWAFPFFGSFFLFGLYLLFKFFDKDLVNLILSLYFLLFGALAMTKLLGDLFRKLLGEDDEGNTKKKNKKSNEIKKELVDFNIPAISLIKFDGYHVSFGWADIVAFIIAAGFSLFYFKTKHWISNNIFGLAFSIQGISLLSLNEYLVGVILLSGLFIYDIFWVFGTDVMVTVAKSFDAPIKLLFPKDIFAQTYQFSMLGLGDIVLPGIFIALLLRFDRYQAEKNRKPFKPVYFTTCLIAYALGLATTIFVMHTFKAAQPALLYLVPFCIGSSLLTALVRGELKELIFSDLGKTDSSKEKVK